MGTNGLNGRSKCTWQVRAEDSTVGPTVYLKRADFTSWFFHWVEWYDKAAIPTSAILPTTSSSVYHIGAYPTNAEVWFNPLIDGAFDAGKWDKSLLAWFVNERNPSMNLPGTIGDIIYYPGANSPFKDTQTKLIDWGIVL